MSHVAMVKTSSERDTQRDRVSRSVTDGRTDGRMDGRTDGRTAGANLEVYIVMGNLRLQKKTSTMDLKIEQNSNQTMGKGRQIK